MWLSCDIEISLVVVHLDVNVGLADIELALMQQQKNESAMPHSI